MSNIQLERALAELRSADALNLPSSSEVHNAKNGKRWTGKKRNGDPWELVKNSETSYNCMC